MNKLNFVVLVEKKTYNEDHRKCNLCEKCTVKRNAQYYQTHSEKYLRKQNCINKKTKKNLLETEKIWIHIKLI